MAITAQKLIWKPEDNGQKGSAKIMTIEERLKADNHSLSANRQMLIIAALVTESLQPVRQPIRMQNKAWTTNAFLRLTLNTLSTIGRHAIKPAKCVPDTARRCEQHDILKSRLTSADIRDLSPRHTAAASDLSASSKNPVTASKD